MLAKMSFKSRAGTEVIDWQSNPHLLISGRTGSQKSTAIENIMLHCMSPKSVVNDGNDLGMSSKIYLPLRRIFLLPLLQMKQQECFEFYVPICLNGMNIILVILAKQLQTMLMIMGVMLDKL